MAYTKPQVVAQNSASGSYAAGCPTNDRCGVWMGGEACERAN